MKIKCLKRDPKSNSASTSPIPYTANKIPFSKKKQYELASRVLSNVEVCVSLANESTVASLFVEWYDEAIDGLTLLMKFEKVKFSSPPSLDYYKLKDEFQWHLCDAIVRAKESAISNIKNKYRNSHEFQVREAVAFENDVESIRDRFANDTEELANRAIDEIKVIVGGNTLQQNSSCVENNILDIDLMEGLEFEHWCAKLLTDIGYSDVSVTQGSGDQGVDVLAQKDGIKYAIQCKCYSSDLGNTPVQEINAGKTIYHCHIGVVMTNRHFTAGAKQAAEATGILLWDRDWIQDAILKRNNGECAKTLEPAIGNSAGARVDIPRSNGIKFGGDEMLPAAVDVILETGQASVSTLQRRLNLGYARAARIVDEMEELGIVGPFRGSMPRTILITKRQWEIMKSDQTK